MSDTPRRKLIEVALPLEAINAEGRRDKSLNRGHPKAIHWWWARRPLAVCRAIIFAQLVDDPSAHPDRFPTEEAQDLERERLFDLMRQLVRWDRTNDGALMQQANAEIRASFEGSPPTVVDPFCGGGSIPVEARRLGLEAMGSDLNPVSVLITKAMIEIPAPYEDHTPVRPSDTASLDVEREWRGSAGLAADVDYYGRRMMQLARERVGTLYAQDRTDIKDGDTPLAWLRARTVRCPNPACGAVIPLVNSFWLSRSSRANAPRVWAKPIPHDQRRWVTFEIATSGEPPQGTVFSRGSVRCLVCEGLTSLDYVKDEGMCGRIGVQTVAVVVEHDGKRAYRGGHVQPSVSRDPLDSDPAVPGELLPTRALGFRVQPYGYGEWRQFFTPRQLRLISSLVESLPEIKEQVLNDGADSQHADSILTYLAFYIDRVAARNSAFSFWHPAGKVESATSTNYMPMRWFFAEANPFADASGGLAGQLRFLVDAIASLPTGPQGRAVQLDATTAPLGEAVAFCTDPPYFDNIPYADLSDFYYVWLKRSLGSVYPDIFSTILTPKASELVADSERHGGRQAATDFFRHGFRGAFDRMIEASHPDVPIVVYYALRQREEGEDGALASTGWEAMLQSLVDARLMVTATWPVRTEQRGGLRAHGRNALASSVVIACRPVPADAPLATVRELVLALRAELPAALRKLQHESIAPVDLAQAAIGPGMAVFSRYARVIEADGSTVPVRRALQLINQVLDELLAEQDGDLDAYTRFAVAWYEQYGLAEGPFGDVETLCKAKNVALDGLLAAGIVHTRPDRIRLRARDELDTSWDPATDPRLTVWEVTQHLAHALQDRGEEGAAVLLRRVGSLGDVARDLAYRLYDLSERRQLAGEARAYNALVVAWPDIARRAAGSSADAQQELEV